MAILPTTDELESMDAAFIQPSDVLEDLETVSTRVAVHLDNQFRLLRGEGTSSKYQDTPGDG